MGKSKNSTFRRSFEGGRVALFSGIRVLTVRTLQKVLFVLISLDTCTFTTQPLQFSFPLSRYQSKTSGPLEEVSTEISLTFGCVRVLLVGNFPKVLFLLMSLSFQTFTSQRLQFQFPPSGSHSKTNTSRTVLS